jgi:hypothetical protein
MVMLTTSKTTTTGVFAMLSHTSMTGRYMTTVFTSLGETGRHFLSKENFDQSTSTSGMRPVHPSIGMDSTISLEEHAN